MTTEDLKEIKFGAKLKLTRAGIANHYDWLEDRCLIKKEVFGTYTEYRYSAWQILFENGSTRYFHQNEFQLAETPRRGHPLTRIFALDKS